MRQFDRFGVAEGFDAPTVDLSVRDKMGQGNTIKSFVSKITTETPANPMIRMVWMSAR